MSILKNISKDSPIGFFDSGVGGLTVLDKVKRLLPNENTIFFGDTLHVPYGEKTKEQLLKFAIPILDFFKQNNCKAVVMACNTTSSLIYEDIKDMHDFKIYPVVQSVAKIISEFKIKSLGVFATKATIESGAYEREIHKYNPNMKVYSQYCPQWVPIVENGIINLSESKCIIKSDLDKMLSKRPEKIILGCTHYPYLTGVLSEFTKNDLFIDPSTFLSEFIKSDLANNDLLTDSVSLGIDKFYCSSNPAKFKQSAQTFYKLDKEPELITF